MLFTLSKIVLLSLGTSDILDLRRSLTSLFPTFSMGKSANCILFQFCSCCHRVITESKLRTPLIVSLGSPNSKIERYRELVLKALCKWHSWHRCRYGTKCNIVRLLFLTLQRLPNYSTISKNSTFSCTLLANRN